MIDDFDIHKLTKANIDATHMAGDCIEKFAASDNEEVKRILEYVKAIRERLNTR